MRIAAAQEDANKTRQLELPEPPWLPVCPSCNGTGVYTFDTSWEEWIAAAGPYGGDRHEWESLRRGHGQACAQCGGTGAV